MKIMKFGGSSLQDAERIRQAAAIVNEAQSEGRIVVVLSAMKGITNSLIQAARDAETGKKKYTRITAEIETRHRTAVDALYPAADGLHKVTLNKMESLLGELKELLHGIFLIKECSPRSLDLIMSFGERLSCILMSGYLEYLGNNTAYIEGHEIILTNNSHGSAIVDFPETYRRIKSLLAKEKRIPVVTGFIAGTDNGVRTTLGRNGSDYTASILGAALEADCIEIWTDVDGVMSADPRYVKEACVLSQISTHEAMELSYFGAEVLHPYTMMPAVERGVPIRIKNTMNPSAPGTLISHEGTATDQVITGIASIENVALINVEGGGMLGIPGVASRIFAALAAAEVNIIMISQASSEHSICIVCREEQAKKALKSLSRELAPEVEAKKISRFELLEKLEIVAVIGENMRGTPGISGRIFSALGAAEVNVLAIAQGSSERNISFVIEWKDREKALNTIHSAFFTAVNG
jgi:aspartokinase/homoserine dehydrogenase 1